MDYSQNSNQRKGLCPETSSSNTHSGKVTQLLYDNLHDPRLRRRLNTSQENTNNVGRWDSWEQPKDPIQVQFFVHENQTANSGQRAVTFSGTNFNTDSSATSNLNSHQLAHRHGSSRTCIAQDSRPSDPRTHHGIVRPISSKINSGPSSSIAAPPPAKKDNRFMESLVGQLNKDQVEKHKGIPNSEFRVPFPGEGLPTLTELFSDAKVQQLKKTHSSSSDVKKKRKVTFEGILYPKNSMDKQVEQLVSHAVEGSDNRDCPAETPNRSDVEVNLLDTTSETVQNFPTGEAVISMLPSNLETPACHVQPDEVSSVPMEEDVVVFTPSGSTHPPMASSSGSSCSICVSQKPSLVERTNMWLLLKTQNVTGGEMLQLCKYHIMQILNLQHELQGHPNLLGITGKAVSYSLSSQKSEVRKAGMESVNEEVDVGRKKKRAHRRLKSTVGFQTDGPALASAAVQTGFMGVQSATQTTEKIMVHVHVQTPSKLFTNSTVQTEMKSIKTTFVQTELKLTKDSMIQTECELKDSMVQTDNILKMNFAMQTSKKSTKRSRTQTDIINMVEAAVQTVGIAALIKTDVGPMLHSSVQTDKSYMVRELKKRKGKLTQQNRGQDSTVGNVDEESNLPLIWIRKNIFENPSVAGPSSSAQAYDNGLITSSMKTVSYFLTEMKEWCHGANSIGNIYSDERNGLLQNHFAVAISKVIHLGERLKDATQEIANMSTTEPAPTPLNLTHNEMVNYMQLYMWAVFLLETAPSAGIKLVEVRLSRILHFANMGEQFLTAYSHQINRADLSRLFVCYDNVRMMQFPLHCRGMAIRDHQLTGFVGFQAILSELSQSVNLQVMIHTEQTNPSN